MGHRWQDVFCSPNLQRSSLWQAYRAEKWITAEEAMNKAKTKLLKIPGKFRRFTIDRKDEIFRGAAKAAGIATTRTIVVED